MKNRFKTMSGALALTFMLLFSAVAFAGTTNPKMANPNTSSAGLVSARNERRWIRHHRRHRRHMRSEARRERQRKMVEHR